MHALVQKSQNYILSSQAGTGGEMRLPLKALDSVLKVKWYSAPQAQVSLRTGSRRQTVFAVL